MKLNLPNKLTLFRIALIPVIMLVYAFPFLRESYVFDNFPYLSLANFLILILTFIGSLTDFLDGKIARSRGLVTDLGKFLDPLADKLLVVTLLVILVDESYYYGNNTEFITWWMLIIILAREFMVTGIRLIAAGKKKVIAASWYGKIKTTLQFVTIIFLLAGCALLKVPGSGAEMVRASYGSGYIVYLVIAKILIILMLAATIFSGADYLMKNIDVLKEKDK